MPRWGIDITASTAGFESAVKKIPSALKGSTDAANKHASKLRTTITDIGKVGKLALPVAGELGEKLGGAVQAASSMAGPFGLAAVGVGAFGLALTGAAVGVVRLEQAAARALPGIEKLEAASGIELISDEQAEQVRAAEAAIKAVSTVADVLTVQMGAELAPAVVRVATDFVALGLAATDALDTGEGAAKGLIEWFGDKLVKALLAPATALAVSADMLAAIADATGMEGVAGALRSATDAYDDFTGAIANNAIGVYASEVKKAEVANADYIARAEALIGAVGEQGKAHAAAARSVESHSRALERLRDLQSDATTDLLSDEQRLLRAYAERVAKIDAAEADGVASATEVAATRLAIEQRLYRDLDALDAKRAEAEAADLARARAEYERAAEERIALERRVSDARLTLASSVASGVASIASWTADQEGAAAARSWAITSAASVIEAGLNTALAVSNAFADVPYPANILAAIQAGVQGGVYLGGVVSAAAKSIPQAYTGLDLGYAQSTGTTVPVSVHPRERVRVETQSEAQRGREAPPAIVRTYIGPREVATTTERQVRRGGPLASQLDRRYGRLGHSGGR